MPAGLPYWRLSAFYFCFFGALGVFLPYWGPYLRGLGFTPTEIGQLMAILNGTKIVAPNIWGWVADRTGQRLLLIRSATLLALIGFAGVLLDDGYWSIALAMLVFSFFWNAALPQFEATTMSHLGAEHHRYSRIRLWGSIGFIVAVTLLGEGTDRFGTAIVPYVALAMFTGLWLVSLSAPAARGDPETRTDAGFFQVLARPEVAGFFLACFLLQASHGTFYAFYTIYLEDQGYRGVVIGALWALGVIGEVGVFLMMPRWLPRFGPRRLMCLALAAAAVRWTTVGLLPWSLAAQAVAQLLHAATFGMYHAVAISLVNHFFRGANQGRGQALYSSMTFGAGVAAGSLISGYLWAPLGGGVTFLVAALFALAATLVAWLAVPVRHVAS